METAALLGDLGHEVRELTVRFGASPQAFTARYLRGIHDHARFCTAAGSPRARTRGIARLVVWSPLASPDRRKTSPATQSESTPCSPKSMCC